MTKPSGAKRLTRDVRKARILRLRHAAAKAPPKKTLTGQQLAALIGISAARFSAMRGKVKGLPEPKVDGKSHLYPAKAAIKAIIAHYDRPETEAEQRKQTVAKMVAGEPKPEKPAKGAPLLDPLGYKRLVDAHAVTTEQLLRQKLLVNVADVRDLVTGIYTSMSQFLSSLPNKIDPGGKLPAEQRTRLEEGCRAQHLDLHNRVKALLG